VIQGNSADSGAGGGIRLQAVNGTEVSTFPRQPQYWHAVSITNNIIVNNMAGWDGAGISLQDALNVNIVNNTIAHNDSLASSGVLANSIGTPQGSAPAGNCFNAAGTASCPQSAGVTSTPNSALLSTTFTGLTLTCPSGHSGCQNFSNPYLFGDVLWQNRSFYVGVGGFGAGTVNQQKLVTLFDAFTNTAAPTQTATGACSTGVSYWDLGVRGDTSRTPGSNSLHYSISPVYSVLTSTSGYTANHNMSSDPLVVSEYCNGSRVPPECSVADGCGGLNGFGVPPGIADSVVPNPVFSLTPSATVDEGNNWINVSWGPLSLTNPSVQGTDGNYGGGPMLGNYALTSASPAVDYIPVNVSLPTGLSLPTTDFFGNKRPDSGSASCIDVGAVELVSSSGACASGPPPTLTSISPTSGVSGNAIAVTLTGTNFAAGATVNVPGRSGITVTGVTVVNATTITATFTISATAPLGGDSVTVTSGGVTTAPVTFTVVLPPTLTAISPTSGARGSVNLPVTLTGTNFAAGATVNVPGGSGITVGGITVNGAGTQITTTFTIAAGATLTARNVTVTSGGVTTTPVTFTVVAPAAPTLTTIAPTSGSRSSGTPVAVTLTGTNFVTGATVNVLPAGSGITVSGVTVVSPTRITATFTLSGRAPTGANTVSVTTAGGGPSNTVTFTVTP
jgi:hypothetical protein